VGWVRWWRGGCRIGRPQSQLRGYLVGTAAVGKNLTQMGPIKLGFWLWGGRAAAAGIVCVLCLACALQFGRGSYGVRPAALRAAGCGGFGVEAGEAARGPPKCSHSMLLAIGCSGVFQTSSPCLHIMVFRVVPAVVLLQIPGFMQTLLGCR
jgi:hypothetical protein